MYIRRTLEDQIQENLFNGKIILLYGARQVGKTTLVKKIVENTKIEAKYLNCDEMDIQTIFANAETSKNLKDIIGTSKLVVLDEAQRIRNIGLKLKLLADNYPETQIIATGSSSFELANELSEPLTGRALEFWLNPFTVKEIHPDLDFLQLNRNLENYMIYGMYPEIATSESNDKKWILVKNLASNYLYKDILKFNNLKNAEIVSKLLTALALQIGNEVSYNELSRLVGVSKQTISNYIDLLEKVFVIFKLTAFSRNLRKEIAKSRKIYFYDLGIRNALINNNNLLNLRNDYGNIWENFLVAEKKKQGMASGESSNLYFWRTYDQQEIDLIEEKDGKLYAYEIKLNNSKSKKLPKIFQEQYKNVEFKVIDRENYAEFLK